MNYQLALELKNAGFLQPDLYAIDGVRRLYGMGKGEWLSPNGQPICYAPSFEELIEACRDTNHYFDIEIVVSRNDRCFANARLFGFIEKNADGETVEIAVAALWLALNKKSV